MKLHLGCGQRYLDGYVNIDLPSSEHTIQKKVKLDVRADIAKLKYPNGSVDEIRLHHVFEHFKRPEAAALVACWNFWLKEGGRLVLEVPDLKGMAKAFVNPFSSLRKKAVAERHLFGSHEAEWAAHFEGYDSDLIKHLVKCFGFDISKIETNSWKGTSNIIITSIKCRDLGTEEMVKSAAKKFLSLYILPDSEDERMLLDVWVERFTCQLKLGLMQ